MKLRSLGYGVLLILVWAGAALAADISGNWISTVSVGDNQITLNYTFKQEGAKLTGFINTPGGDLPLQDGKVEGDKMTFSVVFEMDGNKSKFVSTGVIKGDEISLTSKADTGGGYDTPPMTLKRAK
jgi:hypothetical protein